MGSLRTGRFLRWHWDQFGCVPRDSLVPNTHGAHYYTNQVSPMVLLRCGNFWRLAEIGLFEIWLPELPKAVVGHGCGVGLGTGPGVRVGGQVRHEGQDQEPRKATPNRLLSAVALCHLEMAQKLQSPVRSRI